MAGSLHAEPGSGIQSTCDAAFICLIAARKAGDVVSVCVSSIHKHKSERTVQRACRFRSEHASASTENLAVTYICCLRPCEKNCRCLVADGEVLAAGEEAGAQEGVAVAREVAEV